MEIDNSEDVGPLEILANISEQFILFKPKRLFTEVMLVVTQTQKHFLSI